MKKIVPKPFIIYVFAKGHSIVTDLIKLLASEIDFVK